jgi:hypothetical protein
MVMNVWINAALMNMPSFLLFAYLVKPHVIPVLEAPLKAAPAAQAISS